MCNVQTSSEQADMSIHHSRELHKILPVVVEHIIKAFWQGWTVWLENTDITTQQGLSSGAHMPLSALLLLFTVEPNGFLKQKVNVLCDEDIRPCSL